jgi:hypothetical protein
LKLLGDNWYDAAMNLTPIAMWFDEEKGALMGTFKIEDGEHSGIMKVANSEDRLGNVYTPEVLRDCARRWNEADSKQNGLEKSSSASV